MKTRAKNLTLRRFGKLLALRDSGKRTQGQVVWLCLCSCGNFAKVASAQLLNGITQSCGCLHRECMRRRVGVRNPSYKHGECVPITRLYGIWQGMKRRCSSPKPRFKYWYGKNIQVCKEWIRNYPAFKKWAHEHGYQKHLTIDRIDGDGDYKPENCQWITQSENSKKAWRDHRNE